MGYYVEIAVWDGQITLPGKLDSLSFCQGRSNYRDRSKKDYTNTALMQEQTFLLCSLLCFGFLNRGRRSACECERTSMVSRGINVQPASQIMAPPPAVRAQLSPRAFTNICVDFAGPFLVKQGRWKTKLTRYLCVFACINTGAVDLEMAYRLVTDSFFNVFYRTTSWREFPSHVISDNGAERKLRDLVNSLAMTKMRWLTVNRRVVWKFNQPSVRVSMAYIKYSSKQPRKQCFR